MLLLVIAVLALTDLGRLAHQVWIWPARAAMIVVAFYGAFLWTRRTYIAPVIEEENSFRTYRVPEEQARELQRQAARLEMDYWQAQVFALAIVAPVALRQRVVESYRPNRRTLNQRVSVEVQVPKRFQPKDPTTVDSSANPLMFPVAVFPKGDLHDGFELSDGNGAALRDYSYREYLVIVARVLRVLIMTAYHGNGSPLHFEETHPDAADKERYALIQIMGRIQDIERDGLTEMRASALESLDAPNPAPLRLAADLVRKLSTRYAIVAQLASPPHRRFAVCYSRTLVPRVEPPTTPSQGLKERVRSILQSHLGAHPVYVDIDLRNAWTCDSFHLEVQAPDDMYLAHQRLYTPDGYLENQAMGAPVKPYPRFQRRRGQSQAHFYARFFPAPKSDDDIPHVLFRFYETPPGSDFRATITATSACMLVWLVGFVVSHMSLAASDLGSDAPAFLLAFPGVAASFIGFDTPEHRLLEGSLSARVSLIATAFTSIIASGLYIINKAKVKAWLFGSSLPLHISFLGVRSACWALLVGVTMINTVWISHLWLARSWRYAHLTRRSPTRMPEH